MPRQADNAQHTVGSLWRRLSRAQISGASLKKRLACLRTCRSGSCTVRQSSHSSAGGSSGCAGRTAASCCPRRSSTTRTPNASPRTPFRPSAMRRTIRGGQPATLTMEDDREPGSRGELGGSQFLHDAIMKRAPAAPGSGLMRETAGAASCSPARAGPVRARPGDCRPARHQRRRGRNRRPRRAGAAGAAESGCSLSRSGRDDGSRRRSPAGRIRPAHATQLADTFQADAVAMRCTSDGA